MAMGASCICIQGAVYVMPHGFIATFEEQPIMK
jgi:hypothetical protein